MISFCGEKRTLIIFVHCGALPPPFFFFLQFLLIYQDARKLGLKRPKQKPFHFILLLKTHLWLPIASSTKSQLLSTPAKGLPSLILR